MNKEVSSELAYFLKDKGINIYSEYRYTDFNGYKKLEKDVSKIFPYAPTIGDVVMWLYEKHEIWISVEPPFPKRIILWEYYVQNANERITLGQNSGYNNPIEAYEAAIKYTLENIIKQ